jgi:hypothetical protein
VAVVTGQAAVISKIITAAKQDIITRAPLTAKPSAATIAAGDRFITNILASFTTLFHTSVIA